MGFRRPFEAEDKGAGRAAGHVGEDRFGPGERKIGKSGRRKGRDLRPVRMVVMRSGRAVAAVAARVAVLVMTARPVIVVDLGGRKLEGWVRVLDRQLVLDAVGHRLRPLHGHDGAEGHQEDDQQASSGAEA